jgi:hypothetical protein
MNENEEHRNEKLSCVCGSEEIILLKCPCYPN